MDTSRESIVELLDLLSALCESHDSHWEAHSMGKVSSYWYKSMRAKSKKVLKICLGRNPSREELGYLLTMLVSQNKEAATRNFESPCAELLDSVPGYYFDAERAI